jgi:hypothetical protein
MAMINSHKAHLSIIATTITLSASIALITFGIFENASIAQGQGSNITSSLTPQQKAAVCNPSDTHVNATESHICGIPMTPSSNTTVSNTTISGNTTTNNNNPVLGLTGSRTGATIASISGPSGRLLSSSPTSAIAPQVNAINKQQQQHFLAVSNNTAGLNYTFAAASPVVSPGKLLYLGFHPGTTTDNGLIGKGTSTNSDRGSKHTASSNSESSNHHHSTSTTHHSSTGKNSTAKPVSDHSNSGSGSNDKSTHDAKSSSSGSSTSASKGKISPETKNAKSTSD